MKVQAAARDHLQWLVERTGCVLTPGFRGIEAVDSTGTIKGMVGYDAWTYNAVQAHMAVDAPIAWRSLLRPAFSYPFEEAGRGVIIANIAASNIPSVRLARKFGFTEIARIRDGWSLGEDLVILEMRKENCRWLDWKGQKHGSKNTHAS